MADTFTVIRHFRTERTPDVDPVNQTVDYGVSNLGGITFVFELTFEERGNGKVRYGYALCPSDVNFNKAHGIAVAQAKLDIGGFVEINNYDPKESLVFNAFLDLQDKSKNHPLVFEKQKLFRLYNYMKKIVKKRNNVDELLEALGVEE